jgi:hypothetical protein
MTNYRPRRPTASPTDADLAERDAFKALTDESLPAVRSSAETWRNGLTAFITLVTTGVVIKGRDTSSAIDVGWRVVVTVLIGVGLASAVVGLWQTLAAQAGTRSATVTLAEIRSRHGSVAAYKVALAATAARRMRRARAFVGLALTLLLGGIAVSWWAPAAAVDPPGYLRVTYDRTSSCGELLSADGGQLRLKIDGADKPLVVPSTRITNLKVVAKCG